MWTRKELKEQAKQCFARSYWKMVLAALFLSFLAGGMQFEFSGPKHKSPAIPADIDGFKTNEMKRQWMDIQKEHTLEMLFVFASMLVLLLAFLVLKMTIQIFVGAPLLIGCKKFFHQNLKLPASLCCFMEPFERAYLNSVRIMFLKNVKIFLWSLLFIVPGIVKSYEYSMIPYLLAEQPELPSEDAFRISRQMMEGNKWKSFVLDLSFLGWKLLSVFSLGILYIFYVDPYIHQTQAALYERLREHYLMEQYGKRVTDEIPYSDR